MAATRPSVEQATQRALALEDQYLESLKPHVRSTLESVRRQGYETAIAACREAIQLGSVSAKLALARLLFRDSTKLDEAYALYTAFVLSAENISKKDAVYVAMLSEDTMTRAGFTVAQKEKYASLETFANLIYELQSDANFGDDLGLLLNSLAQAHELIKKELVDKIAKKAHLAMPAPEVMAFFNHLLSREGSAADVCEKVLTTVQGDTALFSQVEKNICAAVANYQGPNTFVQWQKEFVAAYAVAINKLPDAKAKHYLLVLLYQRFAANKQLEAEDRANYQGMAHEALEKYVREVTNKHAAVTQVPRSMPVIVSTQGSINASSSAAIASSLSGASSSALNSALFVGYDSGDDSEDKPEPAAQPDETMVWRKAFPAIDAVHRYSLGSGQLNPQPNKCRVAPAETSNNFIFRTFEI